MILVVDSGEFLTETTYKELIKNDETFEFVKHASTETSAILSSSEYKAMKAEFINSASTQRWELLRFVF